MSKNNILLADLIDPIAPEAISWLPQTSAWKLLLLIVCFFCSVALWKSWIHYRNNKYRRDALKAIARVEQSDVIRATKTLNSILRQVVFTHYAGLSSANVMGASWLEFLDSKSQQTRFTSELGNKWIKTLYEPMDRCQWSKQEFMALYQEVRTWLETHR
ncbi:DUF4381 domain-containing protein [Vibrio superstes]|uniref:DUF4381 domain-containing protein n=1 Tax=Vibrio superstes NBRC 103154 TaxID=1219062 RepID=A0A511QNX8_9VIBR|nr:DUF4381 domain-containing protein [Vibrio superstes]GEM79029.1 hypothetical protein VSU01S_12740 [Vibrio superstes NBRC 103154]